MKKANAPVEIAQLLGLNLNDVVSIDLHFAPGDIANIDVKLFLDKGKYGGLMEILRRYKITELEC